MKDSNYKWVAALIVMMGTFMALLDTTIVDITLPKMMAELNTDTTGIQWVVIAYLTASAIGMTAVGWLGSRINHKNTYLLGLVIFVASSALCGQARNNDQMTFFRLLQGLGEGIIVPISMTMLYEVFPKDERGVAMGIYGLGASFAPAMGPTLGGYITEHLSWRWIFYINLPVGVVAVLLTIFVLRRHGEGEEAGRFDLAGFVFMAAMFSSLIIFLSKGQEKGWLASDYILLMIFLFVISAALFILRELRHKEPIVDLRIYRNRNFLFTTLLMVFFSMNLYGVTFIMPLYLQKLKLYPTLLSGEMMFPGAALTSLAIVTGGILSDKVNPKYVLSFGLIMMTLFTYRLYHFNLDTSKFTIVTSYAMWNVGLGFVFPPAMILALYELPANRVNMGSSLMNVSRLVAGSIGTAFVTTVLERKREYFFVNLTDGFEAGGMKAYGAIEKLSHTFTMHGGLQGHGRLQALQTIEYYIKALASSYAFQTSYLYLALFPGIAAICVYFLRFRGRKTMDVPVH